MKYFVTGATGFVGGRVVCQLVETGHKVVVVVRNPAKAKDLVELGLAVYQEDVTASRNAPVRDAINWFYLHFPLC